METSCVVIGEHCATRISLPLLNTYMALSWPWKSIWLERNCSFPCHPPSQVVLSAHAQAWMLCSWDSWQLEHLWDHGRPLGSVEQVNAKPSCFRDLSEIYLLLIRSPRTIIFPSGVNLQNMPCLETLGTFPLITEYSLCLGKEFCCPANHCPETKFDRLN